MRVWVSASGPEHPHENGQDIFRHETRPCVIRRWFERPIGSFTPVCRHPLADMWGNTAQWTKAWFVSCLQLNVKSAGIVSHTGKRRYTCGHTTLRMPCRRCKLTEQTNSNPSFDEALHRYARLTGGTLGTRYVSQFNLRRATSTKQWVFMRKAYAAIIPESRSSSISQPEWQTLRRVL